MDVLKRVVSALDDTELGKIAEALPSDILANEHRRRVSETELPLKSQVALIADVSDEVVQIELVRRGHPSAALAMTATTEVIELDEEATLEDHERQVLAAQAELEAVNMLRGAVMGKRARVMVNASKRGLTRRKTASILHLSPSRVQQIIDEQ